MCVYLRLRLCAWCVFVVAGVWARWRGVYVCVCVSEIALWCLHLMVEVEDFLGESKQQEKWHFCKHSDHIETKHNHPGQPEESIFTLHSYV